MFRTVRVTRRPGPVIIDHTVSDEYSELLEPLGEDEAVLSIPSTTSSVDYVCQQYVVFSATFQVPAFYFSIHNSSGEPLPLSEILQTSLLRPSTIYEGNATAFSLSTPTSTFPLISQGEHPTFGMPCWYFHPCETASAVWEIVSEVREDDWTDAQVFARWVEVWFMVLGSVVDLHD
ncbi:hypothetical protein SERLA73DRAFT_49353 [Serpula lacrymans var. lacrymans S7.3]|uniref:Ubiquitin-like-conjugating enzyme ATG10 n=1 Tax=Serpula lacrymans var. lacrymans (strain S7.3) TaxID=936435 RepID=F8PNT3_SERL3|nr:hypothetical protein SERLA73DRAFT_49353 [Serpula lacrymans var. lacrymans S7.3]